MPGGTVSVDPLPTITVPTLIRLATLAVLPCDRSNIPPGLLVNRPLTVSELPPLLPPATFTVPEFARLPADSDAEFSSR